jgi:hypothetical protein
MANDQEQVAQEPESEERPTPKFSGEEQTSTSSQADDLVDTLREALRDDLQEYADKLWQSGKDRRISKHESRLGDIESTLSEYEQLLEGGMSKSQATQEMKRQNARRKEIEDLKNQIESLRGDSPERSGGPEPTDWMSEEQAVLNELGMTPNDPAVAEFIRNGDFANEQDYIAQLKKQAFDWRVSTTKKPKPSSSTVAQTASKAVPQRTAFSDYSDDELSSLQDRLMKDYTANEDKLNKIVAEWERRDAEKE